MRSNLVMIRLRDPILLDVATYISTAVMAFLGVSRLPTLQLQLMALALCLTFALLYRFVFRTNYYERRPNLYFGMQAVVMVMLFLLRSEASDAFNFLFYLLTMHAAVVLKQRAAAIWTGVYFGIAGTATLAERGLDGWFAILFYLVVFIVCFIMGRSIQQTDLAREQNQQLIEELKSTQQKLQELAVLEERNRLARDLHDSVKQQVYAISMQLGAARALLAEGHQAYSPVTEAERLAKQAGAELTTLIRELRPPSLEHKAFPVALREYVTEWSRQNGVPADVEVNGASSDTVPGEETLFRVAQEALANVARHSKAQHVSVELVHQGDETALIIEDDGAGFDMGRVEKGVGLDSMRERLETIGGSLEISSQKDQGTKVMARMRRA